jgi:hypothetical protein
MGKEEVLTNTEESLKAEIERTFDFGEAIFWLKRGFKVARKNWNAKGMWVSMTPGRTLDVNKDNIWTKNIKDAAETNGGTIVIRPYLSLKTADNQIQIGWVASQSDTLCNDWCIV